jgi:hypothetical protein
LFSKPRYTEAVSLKFARQWVKYNFGDDARIPWGARVVWVAGLQYVSDQPGLYLTAAAGGLEGICVLPKASEQELRAS